MESKVRVNWEQLYELVKGLLAKIDITKYKGVYGIPTGGSVVATMIAGSVMPERGRKVLFDKPRQGVLVVDDIVDTGRTLERFKEFDTAVIHYKERSAVKPTYYAEKAGEEWICYPYEKETEIQDTVVRQLQYIGENPNREGLKETPRRVVASWRKLYGGYAWSADDVIKVFKSGVYDEIVMLKDIEFFSTCEHHMLPFFGKISVGYIPTKKVIGVSKIARLVEIYSRRLQIQERLTTQVAEALEGLEPLGVMVVCEAKHLCMVARGVEKQNSVMVTSAVKGIFKEDVKARDEFMSLLRG